ncbi:MAG: hypothetical protein ACE5FH_02420 [Candidatus Zixiibacteriota bacterium]
MSGQRLIDVVLSRFALGEVVIDRVLIIGTSCCGKSTFAESLSERTGIAHTELDSLFWQKDWEPVPSDLFVNRVRDVVARDHWIIDGNYSSIQPLFLARATTVIWLNYSFATIALRALRRTCRRIRNREELFGGNRESFKQSFLSRDSILLWVVRTFWRHRREYRQLYVERTHMGVEYVELANQGEATRYLESVAVR